MQTACLHPHPLLLRGPRLCAPPWRPPSSPRTLSGGALFPPPFTRGVCATPSLCANGECRAARKVRPPPLAPLSRTGGRAQRSPPPLPLPARTNGVGRRRRPHSGVDRERRANGGDWEGLRGSVRRRGHPLPPFACGGATQKLRAGSPSLHPFALPYAPQWGRAQPEGGTRSGGAKGKRRPSPIACEHDPACRPACTTREVVLTPPSLQR